MLFPNLGPTYLSEKYPDIKAYMETVYAESITINQSYWSEADTDNRFYVGDQTLWSELYGNLPANRSRMFSFNHIMRIVNMVSGYQRKNRKSITAIPVENGDTETADQFTKILLWACNQEGVLETISDAFHGSLVSGMNLLHIWMDYRQDPVSGNIKVDNCSYNSFLIDPFFKKADLSDCNYIWKRSYVTKAEAISLLPDHAEEIAAMTGNQDGNAKDMRFQFMPEQYNFGMSNLLTYDEFYYRDYRKQELLVDSETGETLEWTQNNKEALEEFLRMYPSVTLVKQDIPTVKLAICVQNKVLYNGPNPLGIDSFPFVPVFAYYNPQVPYYPWRIQGMVRGLRDSQYLLNRRKIINLDILESQLNSGFIYKENALVNPADIFLTGQGKGLALKSEASMTDVLPIPAAQLPPSSFEVVNQLAQEIMTISGANEELMGSASDDIPGILSMLRQGAGLTTLQMLFDNLDRAQKILGGIMIKLIQTNFTPGKVKRIIEQEPTPQFYNKAFGKYDCVIEDGFNTSTQRQMEFAQLVQLKELGVPLPDSALLEAATIQNKAEIIKLIEQQGQQAKQQEQQRAQVEAMQQQAQIQLAQARAEADRGLGLERISRVQENQALAVERRAEAEKDKEAALLNFVKALKEIESIDIMHLEKLVGLSHLIKDREQSPFQPEAEVGEPVVTEPS